MKYLFVSLLAVTSLWAAGCTTAADCESKGLEDCRACSPESNAYGCDSGSGYYDPETSDEATVDFDNPDYNDAGDTRVCNNVELLNSYNVGWVAGGCVTTTGGGDDDDSSN